MKNIIIALLSISFALTSQVTMDQLLAMPADKVGGYEGKLNMYDYPYEMPKYYWVGYKAAVEDMWWIFNDRKQASVSTQNETFKVIQIAAKVKTLEFDNNMGSRACDARQYASIVAGIKEYMVRKGIYANDGDYSMFEGKALLFREIKNLREGK